VNGEATAHDGGGWGAAGRCMRVSGLTSSACSGRLPWMGAADAHDVGVSCSLGDEIHGVEAQIRRQSPSSMGRASTTIFL
jgi:hypothetical protein